MASCPECGGRVGFRPLLRKAPWEEILCPWCRAGIALPRWWRRLRNLLLTLAGATATTLAIAAWVESGDTLHLILLGAVIFLVLGLLLAAESLVPLRTIVPRGMRERPPLEELDATDEGRAKE